MLFFSLLDTFFFLRLLCQFYATNLVACKTAHKLSFSELFLTKNENLTLSKRRRKKKVRRNTIVVFFRFPSMQHSISHLSKRWVEGHPLARTKVRIAFYQFVTNHCIENEKVYIGWVNGVTYSHFFFFFLVGEGKREHESAKTLISAIILRLVSSESRNFQ